MSRLKIWVDGSCLGNQTQQKEAACRIVVDGGPTHTFPLGNVSNNIAEIQAILEGLRYATAQGSDEVEILSDSKVALAWVQNGPAKGLPDEKKAEVNKIRDDVHRLIGLIRHVELRWIPGEEQKADFGNKKPGRPKKPKTNELEILRRVALKAKAYLELGPMDTMGQFTTVKADLKSAVDEWIAKRGT